ncbi:50S ribosome-binding GTPase [Candidatus Pacearchaeota archaeon]|nr:50S ribosome-binding GTPase [Candidatus Pacearchaeota archaeon]
MTINAHPDYIAAEGKYYQAQTLEEKIKSLKKMISVAPGHKGAENLRAQLKTRLKKFNEQLIKAKKSGKSSRIGIKKDDLSAVIVGPTNVGKSSLINILTNAKPKISQFDFTTQESIIGMMGYAGTSIQLIEIPAIKSEYYDRGTANMADTILILITKLDEISEIKKELIKSKGKQIIVFNKIDELNENEKRKISATLSSKKHNFILISTKTKEGIEDLKEKIFQSFDNIRVFTKEPGKEKTKRPMILKPNSTVKDLSEKILKGFSDRIKETKIWGPSSKFAGQKVGLTHKLKDLDVVEFKTG